jgi:hypothetical protein
MRRANSGGHYRFSQLVDAVREPPKVRLLYQVAQLFGRHGGSDLQIIVSLCLLTLTQASP